MRVLITGAAGFLGARLARTLISDNADLQLRLADLTPPPDDLRSDPRAEMLVGDLGAMADAAVADVDAVIHLAAVVSSAAERDFELGMRVNVDGTRALLDAAARAGRRPRFVFASSLAVFGSEAGGSLPDVVTDETLPRPASSYGIQKFIGEQLVADHSRRGNIIGRALRLQTVTVRPGLPNAAASSFLSGIIREPLRGQRSACPVPPDTEVAVASPKNAVTGLVRALEADEAEWPWRTAVTLPALTTTPGEMLAAMDRIAGAPLSALVDWTPDAAIAEIVTSWPARFRTERASSLGLLPDADFESIVRAHVDEEGIPQP